MYITVNMKITGNKADDFCEYAEDLIDKLYELCRDGGEADKVSISITTPSETLSKTWNNIGG